MKIQQKFVAEFFGGLRFGNRVSQIVRQMRADRLDKNAQTNPIVAVIFENLQTGQRVRAVLENRAAILSLFKNDKSAPNANSAARDVRTAASVNPSRSNDSKL